MSVQIISTETFKKDIFDYTNNSGEGFKFAGDKPVILNFFATWCGPCQAFAPALNEAADTYANDVRVLKIDIDKDPEIPALFGIRSVPTTVFFTPNEQPAMAKGNIGAEGLERAKKELMHINVK